MDQNRLNKQKKPKQLALLPHSWKLQLHHLAFVCGVCMCGVSRYSGFLPYTKDMYLMRLG